MPINCRGSFCERQCGHVMHGHRPHNMQNIYFKTEKSSLCKTHHDAMYLIDSGAYAALKYHLQHLRMWRLLTQSHCKLLCLLLYVLDSNFNRCQHHLQCSSVIRTCSLLCKYKELSLPVRSLAVRLCDVLHRIKATQELTNLQ